MATLRTNLSASAGMWAYMVVMAWMAKVLNLSFWSPIFSTIRGRVCFASLFRYFGSWRDSRVSKWFSAVKPALTSAACCDVEAWRRPSKRGATQLSGTLRVNSATASFPFNRACLLTKFGFEVNIGRVGARECEARIPRSYYYASSASQILVYPFIMISNGNQHTLFIHSTYYMPKLAQSGFRSRVSYLNPTQHSPTPQRQTLPHLSS